MDKEIQVPFRTVTISVREDDALRREIQQLRARLECLTREIHPYSEEFHKKKMCPSCRGTNMREDMALNSDLKIRYIPPKKSIFFWKRKASHLLFICGKCQSEYPMAMPEGGLT